MALGARKGTGHEVRRAALCHAHLIDQVTLAIVGQKLQRPVESNPFEYDVRFDQVGARLVLLGDVDAQ